MNMIIVRHCNMPEHRYPEILAMDVPCSLQARLIARSIARSYAEHGWSLQTGQYWFRDENGFHDIWSQPQPIETVATHAIAA